MDLFGGQKLNVEREHVVSEVRVPDLIYLDLYPSSAAGCGEIGRAHV